jgi:hypothetical protein
MVQTPFQDGSQHDKEAIVAKMRQHLAEHDAVRYTLVCEAGPPYPEPADKVMIYVCDRDDAIVGFRKIIRLADCKPRLGKLEIQYRPPGAVTGRFENLLEPVHAPERLH